MVRTASSADQPKRTERQWSAKAITDKILHQLVKFTGTTFNYYVPKLGCTEAMMSVVKRFEGTDVEEGAGGTERREVAGEVLGEVTDQTGDEAVAQVLTGEEGPGSTQKG